MAFVIDVSTIPEGCTVATAIQAIKDGEAKSLGIKYKCLTPPDYDAIKCSCRGVDADDCFC